MRCVIIALLLVCSTVHADDRPPLTADEIAKGWILLFDGESTFGWTVEGSAQVKEGKLVLGGEKATVLTSKGVFGRGLIRWSFRQDGMKAAVMTWRGESRRLSAPATDLAREEYEPGSDGASPIRLAVPVGTTLTIGEFALLPTHMTPLFNGKDLTGWQQFKGDPKREKSTFRVTSEGWLNVKDGPGDLQTQAQFDNFILQLDCISNGKGLNSGIFFRALPGQYQQGYEAQIQNGFKDGDRTKPADFGTGAIYRRQPARRVIPNDGEWFTMTILAHGDQIMTWVNGYPVCDFKDQRPPHENARNGRKTGKGVISIQGHDPTTNLSFRNVRIAELGK